MVLPVLRLRRRYFSDEIGVKLIICSKTLDGSGKTGQRWLKEDFGVDHVQFSWDLIDPWWPAETERCHGIQYKDAFEAAGVSIDATFGGLASYSYAHLLAPSKVQRDVAFTFFKRAIDMTVEMGASVMGTPVGGMDYEDARNPERREELYQDMLNYLRQLAEYGKVKGLKEIHIEATPLITEFPHSPEVSVKMMQDLEGTDIPIKLLVDWGHALYKPLLKEEADIELWFNKCAPYDWINPFTADRRVVGQTLGFHP